MCSNRLEQARVLGIGRHIGGFFLIVLCVFAPIHAQNRQPALQVKIVPADGSYTIGFSGSADTVLHAGVAIELDGHWLKSSDYPRHTVKQSDLTDDLGAAPEWSVTFTGLSGQPDLMYRLRAYPDKPFADIQAFVHNSTAKPISVESIRPIAATGNDTLNLSGAALQDRVLSHNLIRLPKLMAQPPATLREQCA